MPQPEFTRFTRESSPLTLRDEIAKTLANIGKSQTPPPPAEPEPAPAAPDAQDTPEADPQNPEPTPEATETPQETPPEQETDDAPEGDELTPTERARLRFDPDDKVGQMAAALKRRNRDWTLKQCVEAAEKKLGITSENPEAKATEAKPEPIGDPALPQNVTAVQSAIDQLEAQREAKLKEMDFEAVAKMDKELRRLDRQLSATERANERAQQAEVASYESTFVASEARAAELYPDSANPDSEFGRTMIAIEKSLKDTNDDRYHAADKPEIVARLAAKELGIAPKRQGSRTAPAKPAATAPTATQTGKKGVLPTGSSRSVAPATAQNALDTKIAAVKDVRGLRELQKSLGIKPF